MMGARYFPGRAQAGMALVAVLWIVAIMSLVVMGLVQGVRSEVRVTSAVRQNLQAQALGDAAIALAAQQLPMLRRQNPQAAAFTVPVAYAGVEMAVQIRAINGWVNLNAAPPELLALLFGKIGGLDDAAASALAHTVVAWREDASSGGQRRGLGAVEDLLQIPGVDYDLYARVEGFAAVDLRGGAVVDPRAAPEEILQMLGIDNGNGAAAANLAGSADSTVLRFTAQVPLDGAVYQVSRNMNVREGRNRDGLPWGMAAMTVRAIPAQ